MRESVGILPKTNSRIHWPFTENRASFDPELLAARGLRLGRLACLLHLCEHFANGIVGPGAALFPPSLEALALSFQIAEEVGAAEHRAPRHDHRLHLFPNGPLLPVAFEEEVFVDKAAVYDARDHFPITEHHAHVSVFLAAGRTHTHQVVRSFHVEVGREPITRLAQPWLAPVLIQTQHQINLFVRYFTHVSSFGFDFWNNFFMPFFAPSLLTTSAVKPPADSALPTISAALAIQNGHITSSPRSPQTRRLRPLPNAFMDVLPAPGYSFPVVVQNQSKRRVMKSDQRSAIYFAQAVLQIRHNRIGHEQGPRNLEQRRPLDGLHHSPEVPVVVAQVAVPSAARPRLELHRHRFVFSRFVERSELLQQRRKRRLQRRTHADFFCDAQRQILNSCCCRDHFSSLK